MALWLLSKWYERTICRDDGYGGIQENGLNDPPPQPPNERRNMNITYTNGMVTTVDSEDEAREILGVQYPDAVYCDEWQPVNERYERRLVWSDESAADNDNGAKAVALIRREILRVSGGSHE